MKLIKQLYPIASLMFIISSLTACTKELTEKELDEYLKNEKNGTIKTVESGDFKATIVYRPTDVFIKQELNGGAKNVDSVRNKYSRYSYFVLNLQNKGGDFLNSTASNRAVFATINEQLSFNLKDKVYIVDSNNDTAYLADFAFPRLYEVSKATSLLLAFKTADIQTNNFKICLSDIGTVSHIEFEFDKKDFKAIPPLKLQLKL